MSHKALTTGSGTPDLARTFTDEASRVRELEVKFLIPERPPGHVDLSVFQRIERYFTEQNMVRSAALKRLLSRQLDTHDRALYEQGQTLRSRGECLNGDIKSVEHPDICFKTAGTQDDSGALRRGEYETRINRFDQVDIGSLLGAYPKNEYPELHKALGSYKPSELQEFFRIDCIRRRLLVEFPESVTGLKGKRFVGELLLDDVAFVLDTKGLKSPILFGRDLEVEMEPMYAACAYDKDPNAAETISSPLTEDEENRAMTAACHQIQKASGGILLINTKSKATRGFEYHEREVMQSPLGTRLVPNDRIDGKKSRIQPAFIFAAGNDNNGGKPHYLLNNDFGAILRQRDIARYYPACA